MKIKTPLTHRRKHRPTIASILGNATAYILAVILIASFVTALYILAMKLALTGIIGAPN